MLNAITHDNALSYLPDISSNTKELSSKNLFPYLTNNNNNIIISKSIPKVAIGEYKNTANLTVADGLNSLINRFTSKLTVVNADSESITYNNDIVQGSLGFPKPQKLLLTVADKRCNLTLLNSDKIAVLKGQNYLPAFHILKGENAEFTNDAFMLKVNNKKFYKFAILPEYDENQGGSGSTAGLGLKQITFDLQLNHYASIDLLLKDDAVISVSGDLPEGMRFNDRYIEGSPTLAGDYTLTLITASGASFKLLLKIPELVRLL